MSRETILERIRATLNAGLSSERTRREQAERRTSQPIGHLVPMIAKAAQGALVTRFSDELRARAATVISVEDRTGIPAAVHGYLASHNLAMRVRTGEQSPLARLDWTAAKDIAIERGPARGSDAVGLSHAVAGIAETGTLLLASGPADPTTISFLPDTHIVAVAQSAIVGPFEDAIALVRSAYGKGGMPRSLNFISAPSRTGDIGGQIVLGAHGPRRLAVLIYANA